MPGCFRTRARVAVRAGVQAGVDWRILWKWALSAWVDVHCYNFHLEKVTDLFRKFSHRGGDVLIAAESSPPN